jgi:hypothetical protein
MDVKLKWVRVTDPRRVEYWHHRWDLSGEIDPELTTTMELEAEVEGRPMGPQWTSEAVKKAEDCGCGTCAECMVAVEVEALRRLPKAA